MANDKVFYETLYSKWALIQIGLYSVRAKCLYVIPVKYLVLNIYVVVVLRFSNFLSEREVCSVCIINVDIKLMYFHITQIKNK